jgi:hypothetical protein
MDLLPPFIEQRLLFKKTQILKHSLLYFQLFAIELHEFTFYRESAKGGITKIT